MASIGSWDWNLKCRASLLLAARATGQAGLNTERMNWKSLVLLSLSLGLISYSYAQRARYQPQTHQVELQVAGADYFPGLQGYQLAFNGPFRSNAINGLRYTYAYSLSDAFRVGAMYFGPGTWQTTTPPAGLNSYQATVSQWDFQLGYLRRLHTGALQWYAGADLRLSLGDLLETADRNGSPFDNGYQFVNYGLDGVLGYRRFIGPYLSAGLEAQAAYLLHQPQDGSPAELATPFFGEQIFTVGLQANISFHFVKLKKRCTCPKIRRGP